MSGQQIGTVVGGVIGAYFGNPQLGMAIGGLIGGAVSPDKFHGPRIGDGPQQSSAEGVPIPWILGVAMVQGNLVQKSARREVRKKSRQGKGGPIQYTYEAHQDFAIMVCESSATRGSTMVGVQMVKCNGKIVYDMRPGSNFAAESAKWAQGVNFLFGAENQMPHPTLEAITGVGNTPAYRGVFTAVFIDFNLTEYGDSIPTFEWVMVSEGATVTTTTETLSLPRYGEFVNSDWPLASAESAYTYTGRRYEAGGSNVHVFSASTIAEIIAHFNAYGTYGVPSNLSEYIGYSATTGDRVTEDFGTNRFSAQLDVTNNTSLSLVYSEAEPVDYIATLANVCSTLPYSTPGLPDWHGFKDGKVGRLKKGNTDNTGYVSYGICTSFPDEGGHFPFIQGIDPLYIKVTRKVAPASEPPLGDPCLLGTPVQVPDAPGYMVDCEGNVTAYDTYVPVVANLRVLQGEVIATVAARTVYTQRLVGPIMYATDPNNTEAFWEAAYDAAVIAGTVPAGLFYPGDYPDTISDAYLATQTTTEVINDAISVAEAIERICNRADLADAQIDTTEVDQTLLGYPIMGQYDAAECVRPLLMAHTLYASEYDAKLHFRKFGADVDVVIDPADFIEGTDESDESTREQAKEYPRKLSLSYIDIGQNFVVRPQFRQSITPDVRSVGEQSLQVSVVMTDDSAAQLVDILWKRSRARVQGRRKFSLPFGTVTDCYLALTTGEPIGVDGKRYFIEQMGLEDGQVNLELVFDRQSAYTSDVTAIPSLPPTAPPSSISGPTLVAVMNLPVLRDADDRLGVYVAVTGLLDSWRGCLLQVSRDSGATYTTAIEEMTSASVMGNLIASLPLAPSTATDVTNELSVYVHGGELDSITETQRLNEGNPSAIVRVDGTAEVIQFQTAAQVDVGEYELTTLERGRLNTDPAAHNVGARFVQLDDVYFVPLEVGDIGRELLFRAVSFGSSPESNASYPITFTTPVSQTEWRPEYLVGVRTGNDLTVSVTDRHRLGTDIHPVASINFAGFRWTFTVGADSYTIDTEKPFFSFTEDLQIAAFGSAEPAIAVSVAQLNRITGPGPALDETL